jgi:hypothetical protein
MSHLATDIRLEMLLGYLADQLAYIGPLVEALRLQSNASVTTRGKLQHLIDMIGSIWETHNRIRDDVADILAIVRVEDGESEKSHPSANAEGWAHRLIATTDYD